MALIHIIHILRTSLRVNFKTIQVKQYLISIEHRRDLLTRHITRLCFGGREKDGQFQFFRSTKVELLSAMLPYCFLLRVGEVRDSRHGRILLYIFGLHWFDKWTC